MSVIFLRTTEAQHTHIAGGAKADGEKSVNKWCLEKLAEAATLAKQGGGKKTASATESEPEIPAGMVRMKPFEQDTFDVPWQEGMPEGARYATNFKDGGTWYFYDSKDNIFQTESGMVEDAAMRERFINPHRGIK